MLVLEDQIAAVVDYSILKDDERIRGFREVCQLQVKLQLELFSSLRILLYS